MCTKCRTKVYDCQLFSKIRISLRSRMRKLTAMSKRQQRGMTRSLHLLKRIPGLSHDDAINDSTNSSSDVSWNSTEPKNKDKHEALFTDQLSQARVQLVSFLKSIVSPCLCPANNDGRFSTERLSCQTSWRNEMDGMGDSLFRPSCTQPFESYPNSNLPNERSRGENGESNSNAPYESDQ